MASNDSTSPEPRLSNGRTPEQHARIQSMCKILFKARLIENAAQRGKALKDCQNFDWVLGDWYLAVRCRVCGTEFPFSREDDVSEAFYFTDSNEIVLTCMECKYPLPYAAEQILRIQAQ